MKLCLCVIFNHRYDDNIKKLKAYYKEKFANIWFAVPYYNGHEGNVIRTVSCSYEFQGYFPIVYDKLVSFGFTHYIFIADDMLLNPIINENNILSYFSCEYYPYIHSIKPLAEFGLHFFGNIVKSINGFGKTNRWPVLSYIDLFNSFKLDSKRELCYTDLTIRNLRKSAESRVKAKTWWKVFKHSFRLNELYFKHFLKSIIRQNVPLINIPLYGGYSDLLIIPDRIMDNFCHYCACLSTIHVFAECAIPTALMCTSSKIVTNNDLKQKTHIMWKKEWKSLAKAANNSVYNLWSNLPHDVLYIHPIKLSNWSIPQNSKENF